MAERAQPGETSICWAGIMNDGGTLLRHGEGVNGVDC